LDTNLLHHFILRLKQGFMTYKCEKSEWQIAKLAYTS
jgi:hypothetical protein